MKTYICDNVLVPLRCAPSHKSEMESQMLFGEKYVITDKILNWSKIALLNDNCEGWIDTNHQIPLEFNFNGKPSTINKPLVCHKDDNTTMVLVPGSEIYSPDYITNSFYINNIKYNAEPSFNESWTVPSGTPADTALGFINAPYLWGGKSYLGIDCSGLTQLVCKIHGVHLPRNGSKQVLHGKEVSFLGEARKGDLLFFDNPKGEISHVGLLVDTGLIIHASGRVRIDAVDHQGIFRKEFGRYSHKLRIIKRMFD